jgi:hypothetical protein
MLFSILESLGGVFREPVLSVPVLIIESDDWGPGPTCHAETLDRLRRVLERHRDTAGRSAVMTLGVVLSVPEKGNADTAERGAWPRRWLSDHEFRKIRDIMLLGRHDGVFDLHLHGMEHCWLPAVFKAAETDEHIRRWVQGNDFPLWETLPPALQSRWVDGSVLPSRPLGETEIRTAVAEETEAFQRIFGFRAQVAVPPTFIWNDVVERAWAEAGIKVIVTPGRRHEMRDARGHPAGPEKVILNGQKSPFGPIYMVRDLYFEPARGHSWTFVFEALKTRLNLGRPALVETHRFNFIQGKATAEKAIQELEHLLDAAQKAFPELRFLSTQELAFRIRSKHDDLVEKNLGRKLSVILRRIWHDRRLRALACLTGLVVPGYLLYAALEARRFINKNPGGPRPRKRAQGENPCRL